MTKTRKSLTNKSKNTERANGLVQEKKHASVKKPAAKNLTDDDYDLDDDELNIDLVKNTDIGLAGGLDYFDEDDF